MIRTWKWPRAQRPRLSSARGTSAIDLVAAIGVIAVVSGIAISHVERSVADAREAGAARAFAMRVRQTRLEAVRRAAHVGLRFATVGGVMRFQAHIDGNGNGLRSAEMSSGIDPRLGAAESLDESDIGGGVITAAGGAGAGGSSAASGTGAARTVRFALDPGVPAVGDEGQASTGASGSSAAGDDGSGGGGDPIRLGTADLLSFAPTGGGTSGTIYLRGPTRQFAVRIYGPTGRIRLLEFRRPAHEWVEL